jgi:diguanylate cyclase (GGDEF)-like protein
MTSVFSRLRQGRHYDWLSGYLAVRGLSLTVRVLMAFLAVSYILCLVALLYSTDGPRETVPVAMTWIACAGGVAALMLWAWRWPTRAQSVAFAFTLNTGIALACLAHPNALAGIVGCIAFATCGAYVAFFHQTGLVLYNFIVAATVCSIQAVRLAASGHPALAGVDLWLVIQVNIALPVAIQVLVRALAGDLLRADQDPLTGLLNRRAFNHKALGLITTRRSGHTHLVMLVIDLDKFKALNDAHGHTVGDHALVHVANALLAQTDNRAALSRSGGEEFLLAATAPACNAEALATQVCSAIAASPAGVTASIGTACAILDEPTPARYQALLEELITAADAAMYCAKRRGGNQPHHHGLLDESRDRI